MKTLDKKAAVQSIVTPTTATSSTKTSSSSHDSWLTHVMYPIYFFLIDRVPILVILPFETVYSTKIRLLIRPDSYIYQELQMLIAISLQSFAALLAMNIMNINPFRRRTWWWLQPENSWQQLTYICHVCYLSKIHWQDITALLEIFLVCLSKEANLNIAIILPLFLGIVSLHWFLIVRDNGR